MSFATKAKETVSTELKSFPNLDGRSAMSAAEIIAAFPDGITITGFGWWKNGELVPLIFRESDHHFLWAGKILTDMVRVWLDGYGTDAERCSADLAKEGGVKVNLKLGKNKKGQPVTLVNVCDQQPINEDNIPF